MDAGGKVTFTVVGPPIPKARPRLGAGRVFTPERTRRYEALIAFCALRARPKGWPLDGTYVLSARIFYPDARRRDLSNVIKAIEDGMNGVLYADDVQIVGYETVTSEVDRKAPRVEVTVTHRPSPKLALASCKVKK